MPRKSAADRATTAAAPARHAVIAAPPGLPPEERALFTRMLASARRDHFTQLDAPVLAAFCTAAVAERQAARQLAAGKIALRDYASISKTLLTFARALRCCPSARMNSTAAARTAQAPERVLPAIDWDEHFARQETAK